MVAGDLPLFFPSMTHTNTNSYVSKSTPYSHPIKTERQRYSSSIGQNTRCDPTLSRETTLLDRMVTQKRNHSICLEGTAEGPTIGGWCAISLGAATIQVVLVCLLAIPLGLPALPQSKQDLNTLGSALTPPLSKKHLEQR